jgi:UDP-sugar diphosphatase
MSIKVLSIEALKEPLFVKTKLLNYEQSGVKKRWEIADVHDSVAILIYHRDKDAFILVKQLRPAVYLKNSDGYTFELCAGICDKNLSLENIASEEISEECGFEVDASKLEKITSFYTAVGFAGSSQVCFYAEVDDSMKISEGGGLDDEEIEVVYLDINEAKAFIFDESKAKTPGLMFAFMWWFDKKRIS